MGLCYPDVPNTLGVMRRVQHSVDRNAAEARVAPWWRVGRDHGKPKIDRPWRDLMV
jgi:hypothetical protein